MENINLADMQALLFQPLCVNPKSVLIRAVRHSFKRQTLIRFPRRFLLSAAGLSNVLRFGIADGCRSLPALTISPRELLLIVDNLQKHYLIYNKQFLLKRKPGSRVR